MKNKLIQVILLITAFQTVIISQNQFLRMQDPRTNSKFGTGTVSYAEFIVRPYENFAIVDLYMTYWANIPNFNKITDTFEIQHFFVLPENILVTDSWLWVDTNIMRAQILERSQALNTYESIVNRRNDPSVLYKNSSNYYEYRIFPIAGTTTRRVKLSFIIPIDRTRNKCMLSLPLSMVSTSRTVPSITIKIQNHNGNNYITNGESALIPSYDNIIGEHDKLTLSPSEIINLGNLLITWDKTDYPISFEYNPEGPGQNKGSYCISIYPEQIFDINTYKNRKVILVIDHESRFSTITKADVKKGVNYFINSAFLASDSLMIIYNSGSVKNVFESFKGALDPEISEQLEQINLGDISLISSSLYSAYEIASKHSNSVVMVFSSDASFNSAVRSQTLKDNLEAEFKKLPQTFFHDYVNNSAPTFLSGGITYRGNALLYRIISSNSNGAENAGGITNKNLNTWLAGLIEISNFFNELTSKNVEYEIKISPSNGLTFDNIIFENNKSAFTQTGKYLGDFPMKIEAIILEDDSVYQRSHTLDAGFNSKILPTIPQYHSGHKIMKLERENLSFNRGQILNLSLLHRVLSRITAFLALEPNLQEPCFDCEDESSTPTSTNEINNEIKWKVYPNPFVNDITFEIEGLKDNFNIEFLKLFNLNGIEQKVIFHKAQNNQKLTIKMDGSHLISGMYIFKLGTGNKVFSYKVIKM